MSKNILVLIFALCCFLITSAYAGNIGKKFIKTDYYPLSKVECLNNKIKLGLKNCPTDNDHLAGAALACGHLNNLPSGKDLQELAQIIYGIETDENSIYGDRDDALMKKMQIWENDSHIFYWVGEESTDVENGFVRMFAVKGSLPYFAPRDGSGYISAKLGKINFGQTKHIITGDPEKNSNLYGYPNKDVLLAICYK